MTIKKVSTSGYNSVDNKNLVCYISEYTAHIYGLVYTKNSEKEAIKAMREEAKTIPTWAQYEREGA